MSLMVSAYFLIDGSSYYKTHKNSLQSCSAGNFCSEGARGHN